MYLHSYFIAITLVFPVVNMSLAQETKLNTPPHEHEDLKRFVGDWQFEKLSVPGDDSEPQKLGSKKEKGEIFIHA